MTTLRLFLVAFTASALLSSCGGISKIDSRYPTIAQQDAQDQAWGLPPRKSRGNPKMRYQYDARNEFSSPTKAAAPASAPQALAPAAAAPAPVEQISPAIPANLR